MGISTTEKNRIATITIILATANSNKILGG